MFQQFLSTFLAIKKIQTSYDFTSMETQKNAKTKRIPKTYEVSIVYFFFIHHFNAIIYLFKN